MNKHVYKFKTLISKKSYLDYLFLLLFLAVAIYQGWGAKEVLGIGFLIWFFLNPLNIELISKLAIGSFLSILFFMIFKQYNFFQASGVIAFLFLVLFCLSIASAFRAVKSEK